MIDENLTADQAEGFRMARDVKVGMTVIVVDTTLAANGTTEHPGIVTRKFDEQGYINVAVFPDYAGKVVTAGSIAPKGHKFATPSRYWRWP